MNYPIDEAEACGKGANATVSFLHHYLEYYSVGEKVLQLHCDNCAGQNKNTTTILYFGWRVMMGLNTSCSISFMIVGHTKFGPDWFFGLLKNKYRKTQVSSMRQIASVVKDSTVDDQNEAFLVGQDELPLFYYDWHNTSLHSSLLYLTSPATIISPIMLTIQAQ